MKRSISLVFISLILVFRFSHSFAEPSLTFKQPWIAEAPPVSKVLAAYMEITNNTNRVITVESAESKDFSRIEFHRTIHENEIAKMQHQKTLPIPASGHLSMSPGGYHMMLFYPVKRLKAGDESVISIKTTDNLQYDVKVKVKNAGGSSHDDHSHHHH